MCTASCHLSQLDAAKGFARYAQSLPDCTCEVRGQVHRLQAQLSLQTRQLQEGINHSADHCSNSTMHKAAAVLVALAALTDAFQAPQTRARTTRRHMLNNGGNFGQVFYMGYEYAPPNGLGAKLPDGVYEVALQKPCGIVFEELDPNFARGVKVLELVEGGNAAASGAVQAEDLLVGVSAVRFVGAKFERNMYDATKMDFDTVVDAIGSNEEKWNCNEVFLQFKRGG